MAATDLQFPAAMRANLLTLQVTGQKLATAQEQLVTGLKVNTALHSPQVFFADRTLTQRAGDLTVMKDAIGQAISTIRAGDAGITGIDKLLQQARGLTTAALRSLGIDPASLADRKNLVGQFDTPLEQINGVARDGQYGGKNLLLGDGSRLYATPESKAKIQELIGIRRARVTNVSEPDEYQMVVTGSGRITGAVSDIVDAEQNLGLSSVRKKSRRRSGATLCGVHLGDWAAITYLLCLLFFRSLLRL
ncbi:hypothetical protein ABNQ39_13260 [Azospirillum sp. A26]|uniref:flagellin n=1 Tax=Azospirillum sp. A26 TaxID=3160607 RepID=UPI00366FE6FF